MVVPHLVRVTPPPVHGPAWARRLLDIPPVLPSDAVDLHGGQSLLVVVAHPDDETLALGATLADLVASGVRVHVVALTAGEAALEHVGEHLPELAARRRHELDRAGIALGLTDCTTLALPDSRLAEHQAEVETAVREAVERHRPDRVATLWREDPHPDHRAVSESVHAVCEPGTVDEFLLWTVHWTDPDRVPHPVAPVAAGGSARRAREAALREYRTQVEPLLPHLEPVLPAAVVAWPYECVVLR
ncbi:MAG: bifunctional family deacetylase/class SAM-dependent methyltransferase [Marmoricola sp.]|nr:bifunctional family deacetylase/class SAM-dependent methyltransferase [Marmoricola sp.]